MIFPNPLALTASLVAGLIFTPSGPLTAQGGLAGSPANTINHGYAYDHGIGQYSSDQLSARVLSVPIAFTLRSLQNHRVGLRLRVTGMFATHGFDTPGLEDFTIKARGIVPGLELLLPLGKRSALRPFVDLGAVTEPDSNRTTWIAAFGVKSEFVFPWRSFHFGLVPGVRYTTSWQGNSTEDDNYGEALLKLEARHALWFTVGNFQPDIGPYVEYGYYFDALEFESGGGGDLTQEQKWEAGLSIGFRNVRPKLWIFRVPRVAVGYRFGSGVTGLRIRIGGDWIVPRGPQ